VDEREERGGRRREGKWEGFFLPSCCFGQSGGLDERGFYVGLGLGRHGCDFLV